MTDLFAGDIYLPSPRGYLGRRDFAGFGGFYRRAGGGYPAAAEKGICRYTLTFHSEAV